MNMGNETVDNRLTDFLNEVRTGRETDKRPRRFLIETTCFQKWTRLYSDRN